MLSTLDGTWQNPNSKLLPRSIYDILTQISNYFQRSLCLVRCRHGVSHLLFWIHFTLFLSAISIFLSSLGSALKLSFLKRLKRIHFTQTYSLKWAILGNQNHFSESLYLHSKQEKIIVPSQTSTAFTCFLVTLYFEVQLSPSIQSEFGKCWAVFLNKIKTKRISKSHEPIFYSQ